jgi:hypothetical protein
MKTRLYSWKRTRQNGSVLLVFGGLAVVGYGLAWLLGLV